MESSFVRAAKNDPEKDTRAISVDMQVVVKPQDIF